MADKNPNRPYGNITIISNGGHLLARQFLRFPHLPPVCCSIATKKNLPQTNAQKIVPFRFQPPACPGHAHVPPSLISSSLAVCASSISRTILMKYWQEPAPDRKNRYRARLDQLTINQAINRAALLPCAFICQCARLIFSNHILPIFRAQTICRLW